MKKVKQKINPLKLENGLHKCLFIELVNQKSHVNHPVKLRRQDKQIITLDNNEYAIKPEYSICLEANNKDGLITCYVVDHEKASNGNESKVLPIKVWHVNTKTKCIENCATDNPIVMKVQKIRLNGRNNNLTNEFEKMPLFIPSESYRLFKIKSSRHGIKQRLIMPKVGVKTLSDCKPKELSLSQRIKILLSLAKFIMQMHEDTNHPTIHCDLNPSNIRLDAEMNAIPIDFAFANFINEDDPHKLGSALYAPYEVHNNKQAPTNNAARDIYSFSVIAFQLLIAKCWDKFHELCLAHHPKNKKLTMHIRYELKKNIYIAQEPIEPVLGNLMMLIDQGFSTEIGKRPHAKTFFKELKAVKEQLDTTFVSAIKISPSSGN